MNGHAVETGSCKNVLEGVEMWGAGRRGHGVIMNEGAVSYERVKERQIVLGMCTTSNVQTKAVHQYSEHAIGNLHKDGRKVRINTDNRTVSNTTMEKEIYLVNKEYNLSEEDYRQIYLNSVEASFADQETKEWCLAQY